MTGSEIVLLFFWRYGRGCEAVVAPRPAVCRRRVCRLARRGARKRARGWTTTRAPRNQAGTLVSCRETRPPPRDHALVSGPTCSERARAAVRQCVRWCGSAAVPACGRAACGPHGPRVCKRAGDLACLRRFVRMGRPGRRRECDWLASETPTHCFPTPLVDRSSCADAATPVVVDCARATGGLRRRRGLR